MIWQLPGWVAEKCGVAWRGGPEGGVWLERAGAAARRCALVCVRAHACNRACAFVFTRARARANARLLMRPCLHDHRDGAEAQDWLVGAACPKRGCI